MKLLPLLALAFLALLPGAPAAEPVALKWDAMDLGPFQAGTFKVQNQLTVKGLAVQVGEGETRGAVLFDTELLRWSAAWTGGFLKFPRARGGLEGQITPAGEPLLTTGYAPGWSAAGDPGDDPRDRHQGHLLAQEAKWHGLYTHEGHVVLSYTVGETPVLESAGLVKVGAASCFTRTLEIAKTAAPLTVLLADLPGARGEANGDLLLLTEEGKTDPAQTAALLVTGKLPPGAKLRVGAHGRALLDLPALSAPATVELVFWSGPQASAPPADALRALPPPVDLAAWTHGGAAQWGEPLETKGILGTGDDSYLADEITIPEENRFGSWFRLSGHDFLPDGRAVVCSLSGDVWIVSGLDESLGHIQWKRFATGLFQPLGLRVVKGEIYVLGRDQLTHLHDLNGDGEADWYECFNNDVITTENYHEFVLDLQTDRAGNFYFAKGSPWQPTVTSPHQGCMFKLSADGARLEVIATGLRAPNGLGMSPHDELSFADNQGHWMPTNRLNYIRPGGFYGMVPAAHRRLTFATANGDYQADPSNAKDQAEHQQLFWGNTQTPTPREGYDLPLCWIPMPIDNSSGGQVWVPEGEKWGPFGGKMLQMSYGKCTLFAVLAEEVEGVAQAGLVRFPAKFNSGIMRGRFHPLDGQLYLSGLRVWQTSAAKDGCFYRLRYTGKPVAMPLAQHTTAQGLDLTFATPLAESAADPENYDITAWNYLWSGAYGSPDFSVRDPKKTGRDSLEVASATLSPDHRTVSLKIADWRPAMSVRIKYKITGTDGQVLDQEVYSTIHRVPGSPAPTAAAH